MEMIRKIVKVRRSRDRQVVAWLSCAHASESASAWTQTAPPPSFRPDGRATSDRSEPRALTRGRAARRAEYEGSHPRRPRLHRS